MPDQSAISRISSATLRYVYDRPFLQVGTPSPWAVLLIKFIDDPDDEPDRTIYEKLFTTAGTGTDNMPAFFSTMSHGRINLSGSQVFGWYRIPARRADYPTLGRGGLLDASRTAASNAGINLADFSGVLVSAYGATDLCGWVGGMAALCDQLSLQPSLLGQEMGHGYGFHHARRDGSAEDYQDPWDVMSTAAWPGMEEPDSDFTNIGPGLNAQNMRARGWLDESRVWKGGATFETTVVIRPLHWRELSGNLAAQVGEFLVELRVPERWDAAIGEPVVLVHRLQDNHSYVMSDDNGNQGLTTGSVLTVGSESFVYSAYQRIEVLAIDADAHTATLALRCRFPLLPPRVYEVGNPFGAIEVDGSGGLLLPGGQVVHIPPRSPFIDLIGAVGLLAQTTLESDIALCLAGRRVALQRVIDHCSGLMDEYDEISGTPPNFRGSNDSPTGQG